MEKMIKPQQLIKLYEKLLKGAINKVKNSDPERFLESYMKRVEYGPQDFYEKSPKMNGFNKDFTNTAFDIHINSGSYELSLTDLAKNRNSAINKLKKDYISILKGSEEFENHVVEAMIEFYDNSNLRNVFAKKMKEYGYFEFYNDAYDILIDYQGDLEMANDAIRNEPFFDFIEKDYGRVNKRVDLYEPIYKIAVSAERSSELLTDSFFDFTADY